MARWKQVVWFCALLIIASEAPFAQSACERQAVVVRVQDKRGQFIGSLQSTDFQLKLDNKTVPILSAEKGTGARRTVIFFDKRGRMSSALKQKVSQAIASELVRRSPKDAEFALIAFGDGISAVLGFGHSREEVISATNDMTKLPAWGGRGTLYDALLYADQMLRPSRPGDSVLVLGHGDDGHSKASLKDVEHAYQSSGTRIFLMEMTDDYFQSVSLTDTRLDVNRLIAASGGEVWKIIYADEALGAITQDVEEKLWNYYILGIRPIREVSKPLRVKVELVKPDRGGKLAYTEKLLPCR